MKETLIIDSENADARIEFKAKTCIRNVLNVIDAAFGDKLDEKQRYMVRKVVLDEFNDFKGFAKALLEYENTNNN